MIDPNGPPVLARELAVAAESYPYPIAIACRRLLDSYPDDPWEEWERLSRDLLGSVLPFLSHLLLSDLVASGRKDAGLFPLIRDVLARPLAGQYVRFLRETARVIDPSADSTQVPDLVRFLRRSEVESTLLDNGRPLLGTLVDYRNQWAHHGRLLDARTRDAAVEEVRTLSARLLRELRFLADWHLVTEEGEQLMGSILVGEASPGGSLIVEAKGGLVVRPLLLRLDGDDLVLLEEFDERRPRLQYRGSNRVTRLSRRDLTKGEGQDILEELKVLLGRVRALDERLPRPSRNDFIERVKVKTDGTLRHYEEARKYLPSLYIERPEWDGPGGIFDRFLDGDQSLLAISGPPGTGKSALCARLAERARELGHIPLLINAQRLSFTSTEWSANPLPAWFADTLAYEAPLDRISFRTLASTLQSDEQVVVFVDALNEVEGIEQNWNRFVAMERMLEWIVDVAQPRIQFVLTFRLDAYEDFGFLKPDDLPPGLEAIAVSGTRADRPWLLELESFSLEQARAFYERLQAQPQLGMAPDLDWESLATSQGDRLSTYTRNPLLFGIFLKIHHGSTEVRPKDPEELFDAYAARVTGEEALRLRPWWRRAVGFVRNANITPKQRFILDAVDLMTRNGSPGVVAERLHPRGTRAERRVLTALSDGRHGVVDELREAGILVLERIEENHPSGSVQTQRLGFVAELLTVQLDRLRTSVEQRELVKVALAAATTILMVLSGFTAGFLVTGSAAQQRFAVEILPFLTSVALAFAIVVVASAIHPSPRLPASVLGLVGRGVMDLIDRTFTSTIVRNSFAGVALGTVFVGSHFFLPSPARDAAFAAGIAVLITVLMAMLSHLAVMERSVPVAAVAAGISPRIVRGVAARLGEVLDSGFEAVARRSVRPRLKFIGGGLTLALLALIVSVVGQTSLIGADVTSFQELGDLDQEIIAMAAAQTLIAKIRLWTGLVLLGGGIALALTPLLLLRAQRRYAAFLPSAFFPHERRHPMRGVLRFALGAGSVGLLTFFGTLVWLGPIEGARGSTSEAIVAREALTAIEEEGRLVRVTLAGADIPRLGRHLTYLESLRELRIEGACTERLDLQRMRHPLRYHGPASCLGRRGQSQLTLTDMEGSEQIRDWDRTFSLRVESPCRAGESEAALPPNLLDVYFDSGSCATRFAGLLTRLRPNSRVWLQDQEDPSIEWFDHRHGHLILSLPDLPDFGDRGLLHVRKLWTQADSDSLHRLVAAERLEWLVLAGNDLSESDALSTLRSVTASLERLSSLELIQDGEVLRAQGRSAIFELLDGLVRTP